jgi:hypothetical protein
MEINRERGELFAPPGPVRREIKRISAERVFFGSETGLFKGF